MRVMITRPHEDAEPLARLLGQRGIESLLEPLLSVVYLDGPAIDLGGVQALLVTSANGARALARRGCRREVAVLAVGEASARAATEAGFATVETAAGDVEALARLAVGRLDPAAGALCHAAGDTVAGDLGRMLGRAGFDYRRQVLYRARRARRLSPAAARAIKKGPLDGVVLYSPRTAATFVELVRKARLVRACKGLTAWCLSPAVGEAAADIAWGGVRVAARPEQAAMVENIAARPARAPFP